MGNFRIIDLHDQCKWKRYFQRLPYEQQDIYFTQEYYQLYEDLGDGKAQCFVFERDGEIALYPYLLNSINELGFDLGQKYFDIQGAYGYNGVISSSYEADFISFFFSAFNEYVFNNNIVAEFVRFHPIIKNHIFSVNMDVIEDRETTVLDLTKDYDFIWNSCYSGINRNMIRKAIKNNISISISNLDSDYQLFFDIYLQTMKNIGVEKYYYFSEKYFMNIKRLLLNNHKLILAKKNNEVICAMILMVRGKFAHYHLLGRKKEFSNTGVNNLILDEAIKIAIHENCAIFHFGGGATKAKNDTLLKFKSNFSKNRLTFYVGKKIHNLKIYNEIIMQWGEKNPEKKELYKNMILKYRF
jgi:hypothetical protein